jgi:hypothetical protein
MSVADLFKLDPHALNLDWTQHPSSKAKIGEFDVAGAIDQEILGLQIPMNVAQGVQSVDTGEHLCDVKSGMSVVKDASVVEQGSEVTAGHVFHGQVNLFFVLERVEQLDKPVGFGGSQNVSFGQDVSHLVQFEQQLLSHHLEGADFSSVLLLSQIDLAISALTDLRQNLEITMSESSSALAEVGTLSAKIFVQSHIVFLFRRLWWSRERSLEGNLS